MARLPDDDDSIRSFFLKGRVEGQGEKGSEGEWGGVDREKNTVIDFAMAGCLGVHQRTREIVIH